jgi:hypothetical protein
MKRKKPWIEVITEDWGGDGIQSNTYCVVDVIRTDKVQVGQRYTYDQLCRLSNRGIDFEIAEEYEDYK